MPTGQACRLRLTASAGQGRPALRVPVGSAAFVLVMPALRVPVGASALVLVVQLFRVAHSISIATARRTNASSSGSVIGVACRYRTFGLSANTAAPARPAMVDSVSAATIHAID